MDTLKLSPEVFRCRKPDCLIHLSSGGRWSTWSVLGVIPTNSRVSLSRRRNPFASGVAQVDRSEGRREEASRGLAAAERDELARLRRENKQLRLEHDILSKAAV